MTHLKKNCTATLLLLSFLMGGDGIAQLAIGQWRDHLSYKKGIAIAQSADKIYCATESGIFSLEKSNYNIDRLSKINGLSDVGVNMLRYNDYNKSLLIGYSNANIDIVQNNTIYNISDIKQKSIIGIKTINNIYFQNNLAYLACGFGIVVVDMDKKQISYTCYIGANSASINVRDITSDGTYFYAATDAGVYRASVNAPNLEDYHYWQKLPGLPNGIYNAIAVLNGKVYTNLSMNLTPPYPFQNDTVYSSSNGTSWTKPKLDSIFKYVPLKKMEVYNNQLVISFFYSVEFFDSTGTWTKKQISSYETQLPMQPRQAIVDAGSAKTTWIADYNNGIIKNYDGWGGTTYFYPSGPNTSEAYAMTMSNQDLWVARGNHGDTWVGAYNPAEAYKFSNESWTSFTGGGVIGNKDTIHALDSIRDICSVAVDPTDKNHVYLGSLGVGLVELEKGLLVKVWNETNSSLQSRNEYRWIGSYGMTFDTIGNLWVTNCYANNPLSVRWKKDLSWQHFGFPGIVTNPTISTILVDQYNQKWMMLSRNGGMLVFNENGNQMKKLAFTKGSGAIPGTDLLSMAEDLNGEIWIGTDQGVGVFFCPDQVFSSSGCDAQQIYVQQDGHTQLLLITENVTAIAVDGANRKWFGTLNSGVFLMSADGTQQIQHFTVDNSPLLSNTITSIVINPKTGEVFFGTSGGIISYRNDATEGLQDYTDVYVFPNPVNPGYTGPIAITGLVANASVKITDISGTLVYETTALGGQAIWYGNNFKGQRAHSGVYMVFCSNDDGTKTYITKILLVN